MEYSSLDYITPKRMASYEHQVRNIIQLEPDSVLEIGVGAGITPMLLRKLKKRVISVDILHSLNPSLVADIRQLPFCAESFDVIACFQVLEHIPFDEVATALSEFHRIVRKGIVISVPIASRFYSIEVRAPILGHFRWSVDRFPSLPKHVYDGTHYWELGKKGTDWNEFSSLIHSAGFKIIKHYRCFEYPYHYFVKAIPAI